MTLLQIYCLVCFERIFKIAQYLAKLQEKKLTPISAVCAGSMSCSKSKNLL